MLFRHTVDKIVAQLSQMADELATVTQERQTEITELSDKMTAAITERDRASRIGQKLQELLK